MYVVIRDICGVIGILPSCRVEDRGVVPQIRAVVQVVEEDVDEDIPWNPILTNLCDFVSPPASMSHKCCCFARSAPQTAMLSRPVI